MVILTILLLTTLLLIAMTVVVVSVGGAIGIVVFGDVIVCILVLVWLIKKLIFKK